MKSYTLLTAPISLNLMYNGRRFLNERGKDTKRCMEQEIALWWKSEMILDDVTVNVMFHFKDKRKKDIDSHLKVILDSMSGIVYKDDSQITEMHVYKEIGCDETKTVIQIL